MKRPHLPECFYGVLTVRVPKVNVLFGLLGVVAAYAGLVGGWGILTAIGLASLAVMPFAIAFEWIRLWRFNRKIASWPVSVHVTPGPDGGRVALITTHDGSVSSMILPDGYDPSDDNGRWFMEQIAPDLAAMMVFDDEEPE